MSAQGEVVPVGTERPVQYRLAWERVRIMSVVMLEGGTWRAQFYDERGQVVATDELPAAFMHSLLEALLCPPVEPREDPAGLAATQDPPATGTAGRRASRRSK